MHQNGRMKKLILTAFLATPLLATTLATQPACAESKAIQGGKEDLQAFRERLNKRLGELDSEIEQVRQKVKSQGSEAHDKVLTGLEDSRSKIESELNSLQSQSKSSLKKAKKNLSEAVESLAHQIQESLK